MRFDEEVAAGAAWLDANAPAVPPWYEIIDLDLLDMSDCGACVLGQVFDPYVDEHGRRFGYDAGLRLLCPDENTYSLAPIDHGFNRAWAMSEDWADLRDDWVAVITARRADAAMADRAFDALGVEG